MKSPDPLDVSRLEVERVSAEITHFHEVVTVTLVLRYTPWEPGPAQNPLFEQSNALRCVDAVLKRGGLEEW